ncbi:MAG: DUF1015 domain-containing protein [Candidatus Lokiarchaeota archaeon]|nr:DUF1015 domain-containing protein [Candidatus Harpocratesius repetitus]
MVKITPISPYLPINPEEFCTNPYDVIGKEEEHQLKKNPNSLVHLILPEGEGEEIYKDAKKAYERFKAENLIKKAAQPSIFVYRQESPEFSQEGLIMGVALQDYEDGNIVRHEHTREKPLKDRTKHIATIKAATGLVWNVFQADAEIKKLIEQMKQTTPKFDFHMKGYRQLLWQITDEKIITNLKELFADRKIFIADGHHRAASAAEYRKMKLAEGADPNSEHSWQYLMTYVSSDDQIWILPYNRVIRKLPMSKDEFIEKLREVFTIELVEKAFNPDKKHVMAICVQGQWLKATVKDQNFTDPRDALDVAILQDRVLDPILGIKDIRNDKNIFFVGEVKYYRNPELMKTEFIEKQGNDVFFNLFAVDIHDIEKIGGAGGVMPPKSTWFEPKLLSGLAIYPLDED